MAEPDREAGDDIGGGGDDLNDDSKTQKQSSKAIISNQIQTGSNRTNFKPAQTTISMHTVRFSGSGRDYRRQANGCRLVK
jgi:hypothetical protein